MEGRNNGTFIYKWRIFQHAENCLRSIWGMLTLRQNKSPLAIPHSFGWDGSWKVLKKCLKPNVCSKLHMAVQILSIRALSRNEHLRGTLRPAYKGQILFRGRLQDVVNIGHHVKVAHVIKGVVPKFLVQERFVPGKLSALMEGWRNNQLRKYTSITYDIYIYMMCMY